MWCSKSIQSLFMAAFLSTQVFAGDEKVPRPSDLGLHIPKQGEYGWKEVETTEGFFTKVYVCEEPGFIEVASIENPKNNFKSYQALMSIWEHESRLTVASLAKIMYDNAVGTDQVIINEALRMLGYDPLGTKVIYGIEISRDSPDHAEIWNLLSRTSFAKDATQICTEFQDMSNRYIQSYKIGRYYDTQKWMHITFATNSE
ncbi:hypothetical protein HOO65_070621 [Ceratocystis lukuohia]|uniref:Uncharacterized protein n=1 Tax=Ceratocystis lukuohia TaxID=2019550 RepID=A0ABR4MD13_9PEZI